MKKILKFFSFGKIILGLLVLGVGYWIYGSFINPTSANTTLTLKATAKVGSIQDSISVIGTADLINDQKIRFNQNGTINAIHFKQGDKVKKGQVIVELDKTDLNTSIRQSQISLSDANIKLQQDLEPPQNKDVLSGQSSISKTQTDLQSAQNNVASLGEQKKNSIIDLQNQIKAKQDNITSQTQQLKLANNALDLLTKQEGQNDSNTNIDAKNAINTAFINSRKYLTDAQSMLTSVDSIFGFTQANQYKTNSFASFLSAKDTSLKNSTESDWNIANNLLQKYNSQYDDVNSNGADSSNTINLLNGISTMYSSLVTLGNDASKAINASIASDTLTQSQIDSDYSNMLQIVNQSQSNIGSIQTTNTNVQKLTDPVLQKQQSDNNIAAQQSKINDITTAINGYNNDLASLNNKLTFTSTDYDNQIKQAEFGITNLQNNLETSNANLDYLKKGATKEQIASDKNNIAKAGLALQSAQSQIDKYQIAAPFDGVITQIDFKIGDNLSTQDNTEYVYINNPNLIELTAQLDQIDIGKVKLGQKVIMTFDPFPDTSFSGAIGEIDPTPIITSGVTSYNVKITFDKGKYDIYTGMTAKINIIISSKDNILIIPTSFIQKRRSASYVTIDDGTASGQTTEVVTGLSSTTQTEVVSGLNEGDKIIRKIVVPKAAAAAGTGANRTSGSIIPGVGGGGGGGFGGGGGGTRGGGGGGSRGG